MFTPNQNETIVIGIIIVVMVMSFLILATN